MSTPERATSGLAFFTYDGTLTTDVSMVEQQKQDLSGNTSVQTFCNDAFSLAIGQDISAALFTDSDVSNTAINTMVYIGSKVLSEQQAFMSDSLQATLAQNIASNAYNMTLGKNNKIPILSYLESLAVSQTYAWDFRNKTLSNNQILDTIKNKAVLMTNILQSDILPSGVKLDGSSNYVDLGANTINVGEDFTFETLVKDTTIPSGDLVNISGGAYTKTIYENYAVYSFTQTGVDYDVSFNESLNADYLVVAGGGGGGKGNGGGQYGYLGGGGGGGGFLESQREFDSTKNYKIRVGSGGATNSKGGNSYIEEESVKIIESIGGGWGGNNDDGGDGGCGGGSGAYGARANPTTLGGTGSQGGNGAHAYSGGADACGGGGGGAGGNAPQTKSSNYGGAGWISGTGGNGGIGKQSAITGISTYYAGGGAGAGSKSTNPTVSQNLGGLGGGANTTQYSQSQNGTPNTGGGGSGERYGNGGSGGSGIVI